MARGRIKVENNIFEMHTRVPEKVRCPSDKIHNYIQTCSGSHNCSQLVNSYVWGGGGKLVWGDEMPGRDEVSTCARSFGLFDAQ